MKPLTTIALGNIMPSRTGSVDPKQFRDEVFDLYSIPAFDTGQPEVLEGAKIGSTKQVVCPGDILLSKIVPHIRRSWVVGPNRGRRLIASGEWIVFRGEGANPRYLRHVLVSDLFHAQFMRTVSGVGGSLLRARPSQVAKLTIPYPPLAEQRRIAAVLDQADTLRAKRRQAIVKLNALPQSVFLDMFGDPVLNPKKWPTLSLGAACAEIYRYPTFYGFKYADRGVPVVRIGNIGAEGRLDSALQSYVFVEPSISTRFPRTILEMHDTVMAVRGDGSTGTRIGLVASSSVVGANLSPNLLRFKANASIINPLYLYHFLTSEGGQQLIDRFITRTAKKTITATNIKSIQIPAPTQNAQRRFCVAVGDISILSEKSKESLRLLEHLFLSLQQRAFAGELLGDSSFPTGDSDVDLCVSQAPADRVG